MSRTLLVTGGAGFIGANFVRYWLDHHPEDRLLVLDALTYAGNLMNLDGYLQRPGLHFARGDIRDRAQLAGLFARHQPDTVVHFAAESHVDRSIEGPAIFVATNVAGTQVLLDVAREYWLAHAERRDSHRFHHVSTDEVFGSLEFDAPPFDENSPYQPSSPYAASKAAADHLVRAYARTYGLRVSLSNCSNNYGPYQFPEKLLPLCIVNAVLGRPLPLYGKGLNVRDWLHVEDHCRALELILERAPIGSTYNVGGGGERTNLDIVKDLCARVDEAFAAHPEFAQRFPQAPAAQGRPSTGLIRFVSDRPGHDLRYAIAGARLRKDMGYSPRHDLNSGLKACVDWYLNNEPWWRAVMDGSYKAFMQRQYGERAVLPG
jgi:dTDP-glucose 4,6-dehydratase